MFTLLPASSILGNCLVSLSKMNAQEGMRHSAYFASPDDGHPTDIRITVGCCPVYSLSKTKTMAKTSFQDKRSRL